MRRLITLAILAALVSTSAACGDSGGGPTAGSPTTAATTATASPSPTVDLKANSKAVCDKAKKIVTADSVRPIGEQIGIMIAARQAKNKAGETAAMTKAKELADGLAKQVSDLKTEAADPKLQAALDKAAAGIALFGSPEYLSKINSLQDMSKMTTDIQTAAKDLETICGA